jgi:hypothetical protein
MPRSENDNLRRYYWFKIFMDVAMILIFAVLIYHTREMNLNVAQCLNNTVGYFQANAYCSLFCNCSETDKPPEFFDLSSYNLTISVNMTSYCNPVEPPPPMW